MLKRILLCIVFAIALFNGSCIEEDDTITTFTVSFDSLVGDKIENIEVEEGKTVDAITPLVNEGYNFLGWTLEFGSNNYFDFSTPIESNLILYAVWEKDPNYNLKDY